MGTAYKGNAMHYHSVGQNILPTSSKYKYKSGYFGENSKHGNNRTRNIASPDNLSTAKDFYNKIAHGGKEQTINSDTKITKMADGTIITMRTKSSSDGTPVVDINIKPSSHTGGVKSQKIHFVQEGD
ncbi:MAG: hypothetical protein K6C05_02490 [Anaerovibrio sp.]|uniref:hypothetical protein n=1 Tax=Anaerovibrio sp. TaxID=1872532 RepID=UPI0025D01340|nr:hypothetical protein [Anaerovibrio sp.]MCR5175698.1 hypothetical protein [Anaerovibrio sp.]